MKRIFALLFSISLLFSVFAFTACDIQETVDSARSNLMESAKDLLDPFLNQNPSESSTNTPPSQEDVENEI